MNGPGKQAEQRPPNPRLPLLLLLLLGLGLWGGALSSSFHEPGPARVFSPDSSNYTILDPGLAAGQTAPPHLAIFTFEPISVNQADHQTLIFLPGIGPALAGRIIEYRRLHGSFQSIEQLLQVRGIGPKTLERIRPLITI